MRQPNRPSIASLLFPSLGLALLAACASSAGEVPKGGKIDKPVALNGFVSNAQVPGLVIAEARYSTNLKPTFGADLLDDAQIVAVLVKIGLPSKSDAEQDVQLTLEQMEFRLHLQDGTVLEAVPAESVLKGDKEVSAKLVEKAMQNGFLKLSGGVKEGYLYFKLRPKEAFEIHGTEVLHVVNEIKREIDLSRSLLSFQLTRGAQATPFFIGVAR